MRRGWQPSSLSCAPATGEAARHQAFFGHYREQLIMHHSHEDELFFPPWRPGSGLAGCT